MRASRNKSAVYHVLFYPKSSSSNRDRFNRFTGTEGITILSEEANYISFSSKIERGQIWKDCIADLKPGFHFALVLPTKDVIIFRLSSGKKDSSIWLNARGLSESDAQSGLDNLLAYLRAELERGI